MRKRESPLQGRIRFSEGRRMRFLFLEKTPPRRYSSICRYNDFGEVQTGHALRYRKFYRHRRRRLF